MILLEALIFLLALLWDRIFGEMPRYIHPVVWFGKITEVVDKKIPRKNRTIEILGGILLLFILFTVSAGIVVFIQNLKEFSYYIYIFLSVYFLKSTFSLRSLEDHAFDSISQGLRKEKVAMMVSRDVSELDNPHLASAVIESLGDNIVDGFIAPLFYYLIFGLVGALIYRAVNTLDAMVGYRNDRHEWVGKIPARIDDILNFIPARISAILIVLFYPHTIKWIKKFRKIKLNAGYPISALAGALRVNIEKIGYYSIPAGKDPDENDVVKAIKIIRLVALVYSGIILIILFLPDFYKIQAFPGGI